MKIGCDQRIEKISITSRFGEAALDFLGQARYAAIPNVQEIWGPGGIRLFISHKSENSGIARDFKSELLRYDVASFVAHEDVAPTEEWQNVIQCGLSTMDILVVLLTEEASASHWVDQEIGFALGSNTPIIPIRLGIDPFGFISRIQALSGQGKSSDQIVDELFELMLTKERLGLIEQAKDAFVVAVRRAQSFRTAAKLGEFLPKIDTLTGEQTKNLIAAYNGNDQAYRSFGLRDFLVPNLNRLSNHVGRYEYDEYYRIVSSGYEYVNGYGAYESSQQTSADDLPW